MNISSAMGIRIKLTSRLKTKVWKKETLSSMLVSLLGKTKLLKIILKRESCFLTKTLEKRNNSRKNKKKQYLKARTKLRRNRRSQRSKRESQFKDNRCLKRKRRNRKRNLNLPREIWVKAYFRKKINPTLMQLKQLRIMLWRLIN